jgi:hypothetical protein
LDIDLNFDSGKIIAGTFGRSIYSIDITNIVLSNGNKITANDISIYPNPSVNFIQIQSKNNFDGVEVYSLNGKLMKTSKSTFIDVSSFHEGTYLVKINCSKYSIVKRFLKM